MTTEDVSERETSTDAFAEQLADLVRSAAADEIDVEGAWVCSSADKEETWEVLITRVET